MNRWRDYIRFSDTTPRADQALIARALADQALIARALDDIWATPEGRELIMRTRANAGGLLNMGSEKIQITTSGIRLGETPLMSGSSFGLGTVNLNFNEIARAQFQTSNDRWRNSSLTEILVHELFHAADVRTQPEQTTETLFSYAERLIIPHIRTQPQATAEQSRSIGVRLIASFLAEEQRSGGNDFNYLLQQIGNPDITVSQIVTDSAPLVAQLTAHINGMSRAELRSLAHSLGLEGLHITPHISGEHINRILVEAAEWVRNTRNNAEELSTDFTDFFMLKYYGVEPRENYANGRLAESPQININSLPNRRWFPEVDITLSGQSDAILEELREYQRAARGVANVPQLPPSPSSAHER